MAKKSTLWTWGEFKTQVDAMVSADVRVDVVWLLLVGQEEYTGLPKKRRERVETDWSMYLREPIRSKLSPKTLAQVQRNVVAQVKRSQKKADALRTAGARTFDLGD